MDHLGQKRKAPADHAASVYRKLRRREVEGAGATWVQRMSNAERMQLIKQYSLKPIMEEDMPGLLDVVDEDEKDKKYIFLLVEKPNYRVLDPLLVMYWESDFFRAMANPKPRDDYCLEFDRDPPIAMGLSSLETQPTLVVPMVSTIEDLIGIAPALRRMASIVFRDVWLFHLISKEEKWHIPDSEIVVKRDYKTLISMNLGVHNRSSGSSVFIHVSAPTAKREGIVEFYPRDTSEHPVEYWKERLVQLACDQTGRKLTIPRYNTHAYVSRVVDAVQAGLVQLGCDPTARKLTIRGYNTHADAPRVVNVLRAFLLP